MFYPVDSLKRGGRFYLCWLADSWPLRFLAISPRQLWSQDIRKMCDDLQAVIYSESGRPLNRFSLRLSSQLMRGLVRVYQKKVNVFLNDLCMINYHVFKHANKKYVVREETDAHTPARRAQIVELPQVQEELQENEQNLEDMLQTNGNIIARVADITLREEVIPDFQLPPNDGFGEEHPNQAIQQLVGDRTMEMMMVPTEALQHSGLDLPVLDSTEKSHDRSRLVPVDVQMERISEYDVSLFRKSMGDGVLPEADIEKEIPEISEIPEIPIPESPPQDKSQEPMEVAVVPEVEEASVTVAQPAPVIEDIELEELESNPPKRRRNKRLVVDKKIQISSNVFRERLENPNVELRCLDSSDDIIEIQVPSDILFRRMCHAGDRALTNVSDELTRMFMRNLDSHYRIAEEREIEPESVMRRPERSIIHQSTLNPIEEIDEQIVQPQQEIQQMEVTYQDVSKEKDQRVEDISDLLTQKIDTVSQNTRKRKSGAAESRNSKRRFTSGMLSFRQSQKQQQVPEAVIPQIEVIEPTLAIDVQDKENIPSNFQETLPRDHERSVTALLQKAGLADIQATAPEVSQKIQETVLKERNRRQGSGSSETQLGSLDRTKVSLGDSDDTTDSQRFIREQWGTEGTMLKILKYVKQSTPLDVKILVENGPIISEYKRIIAARCFNSILKLKQHGFIRIKKDPSTLEIQDIMLGPKFY